MLFKFLLVGCGGFLGAMLRYAVSVWLNSEPGHFPWGTLTVNLAGCLAMGILLGLGVHRNLETQWLLLGVGVLGALTTYSAFSGETVQLWMDRHAGLALANVLANLAGSLLACGAGYGLVQGVSG